MIFVLINLAGFIFDWLFVYFFNWAQFFNKGIWNNLHQFHFPSSNYFSQVSAKQMSFPSLHFIIHQIKHIWEKTKIFHYRTFLSFLYFLSSHFSTIPTKQTLKIYLCYHYYRYISPNNQGRSPVMLGVQVDIYL